MALYSRRDFFATTARGLAGAVWGAHSSVSMSHIHQLPPRIAYSSRVAKDILPDSASVNDLQRLAHIGVDAARASGATYADIRISEVQRLYMAMGDLEVSPYVAATFTYGIRVLVDGAWAFVHGAIATADAIATSARTAVDTARGYARLTPYRVELTPAPPVTGEWETPQQIDPFMVPLEDQSALLGAYGQAAGRVRYGGMATPVFDWTSETRVFASSDGSIVTQRLHKSMPTVTVVGFCEMGYVHLDVASLHAKSGGYETVIAPSLQDEIKMTTEEAVRLASLRRGMLDVGRYPVVFNGAALSGLLGRTLGVALELDRVLGDEADASGNSIFELGTLGMAIASPSLTLSSHRDIPSVTAVKWDDEGVIPTPFTLIQQGVLTDYCTSRETASALRTWYTQQRRPLVSHGCAIAPTGSDVVLVRTPHLVMSPGASVRSDEELYRDIEHGVVVRSADRFMIDAQCTSGTIAFSEWHPKHVLLEVEHGRISRRLYGNALQFGTGALWRDLTDLGDATTMRTTMFTIDKGQPWRRAAQCATTPAARFANINVTSMARSL